MPRFTADDRIRKVCLYGLRSDPRWWLRPGRLTRETHARLSRRARSLATAKARRAKSNTALMFTSGYMAVMYGYYELSRYWHELAMTLAGIGMGWITWLIVRHTMRDGAMAAQLIGAFLEERLCPACGCGLRGVEAEADGCSVCPECGAAWRLDSAEPAARQ